MKVLLIEDDSFWQTKMQMMLKDLNIHNLTICGDILTAKISLAESIPDLIVADILLENGTVFQLFEHTDYKDIPILFITASENEELYKESKIGTTAQYLVKPFHKLTLLSAIDKLIKSRINQKEIFGIYVKGVHAEKIFLSSDQIVYIKSELNYCIIKTPRNQFATKGSLVNIAKNLGDDIVQIHKTYLVNKKHIHKVDLLQMKVEITNGTLPLGRVFKKNIYQYLAETAII